MLNISSILLKFITLILTVEQNQSFPPPLSQKEEEELFLRLKAGDCKARDKIIEHNLRLVSHIVRKYYSSYESSDELISIGSIGLIKATDSYKFDVGTRFATYAARCIQNEILMFFRKQRKHEGEVSINDTIDVDKDGNPFTFPIPTVNIDEDFDWNHPNVNILFENTARYGTSYFQNFIGSQYKRNENGELVRDENAYSPADIRSMCPLTLDTEVMTNHGIKTISDLDPAHDMVFTGKHWTCFEKSPIYHNHRIYEITFENGSNVSMSALHEQPLSNGHKKYAQDLILGDECNFYVDGKIEKHRITRIEMGRLVDTMCLETENDDHTFVLANGLITSNCRLQLDKTLLRKRGGGLFGSDAQTGSIGVVTINLARLGYLFKGDLKGLYKRLDHLMDLAKSTLEKKRVFVKEMNARGLYPYTRRYLKSYDTYFSTIGVNGGNEMIRNFTNDEYDITDGRGQKMAKDLLAHIRERLLKYQDETGNLYNLEATPAEGTTYRFAREDQKQYGDAILQAGTPDAPYYTNSTQLPVYFTDDIFSALDLQDDLQKSYTGGTVLHIYTDEEISAEECKTLIKKVISNYRLPYISFTATFSTCPKHGRIPGVHEYCPLCDKELMEQHIKEIDLNKE